MSRRAGLALAAAVGAVALAAGAVIALRVIPPIGERAGRATRYQCAMHPEIVADAPGICPICRMQLEPADDAPAAAAEPAAGAGSASASAKRKVAFYRHPMRPDVTSPEPAKDEMGMDYIAVYEDEAGGGSADAVPGHAPFALSPERQQLIGVTRAPVERRALAQEIRAAGRVAYDPALYQAIVEYREAQRAKAQIHGSPWAEAHEGADALLRAAALKLRQQGLSDAQIRALAGGGDPTNLLLPGKAVWIYAQVYEAEAALVKPGQALSITTPALPGRTYAARVASVDPILNPTSRTVRVRALVDTPDEALRPETFVDVRLRVPLGEVIAVPEDAVLDAGAQRIAFVVRDDGTFEPRALELGREAEGYYEVRSGVAPGEQVVTSANFLIDSESRFKAAVAAFKKSPGAAAR